MLPTRRMDHTLLRKGIRSGSRPLVQRMLRKLDTATLAPLLLDLSPAELRIVLEQLMLENQLVLTLHAFPDDILGQFLGSLGDDLLSRVVVHLAVDQLVRIAKVVPDELHVRLLSLATPRTAEKARELLSYPPDSAAGRMATRFVSVKPTTKVGEAIRIVRAAPRDVPLFYLYVVDEQEQLVGVASLAQLVKSADDTPIGQIMTRDVISVAPNDDQEKVARTVSRRNLLAVPVTKGQHLLGIVTIDDVIDVLEKEATEDMYNLAGLSEGDRVFSSPARSLRKRLPWNALNLLTSLMAAFVVGFFEGTIGKFIALATFMPVIAGIGGNSGNQTLTVIIRGITLGEIEFSTGLRALAKELTVGLSIGVILGAVVATIAVLWKGNVMLGAVIAMAMIANLLIAALMGTAIPLTLKRLGLDPALGGSVLLTMFTDVFGFLCFLGLASLMINYLV